MAELKYHGPADVPHPEVELVGKDGNVYSIIGLCKKAAKDAGWSREQIETLRTDMMSGNYDHALQVAITNFEVS